MWKKESIRKIIENFAVAQGYHLTEITKQIDKSLSSTDLSNWMDTINGHSGGWYHRARHGHDFFANLGQVYEKFGFKGCAKYPLELIKDSTTPHGIPLPGTQFLVSTERISSKFATEWLSMNLADVFSGGIAVCSTFKLYKNSKNGEIDNSTVIWATIGLGIKISAGIATTNPVLILSGVVDTAILISNFEESKKAFNKFFSYIICDKALVTYTSFFASVGVATATTTTVAATCAASTGTMIATLSGAAATNATLAAIGGGSLATGGLGVAGGLALLSGGSAIVGVAFGLSLYKLKQRIQANKT